MLFEAFRLDVLILNDLRFPSFSSQSASIVPIAARLFKDVSIALGLSILIVFQGLQLAARCNLQGPKIKDFSHLVCLIFIAAKYLWIRPETAASRQMQPAGARARDLGFKFIYRFILYSNYVSIESCRTEAGRQMQPAEP